MATRMGMIGSLMVVVIAALQQFSEGQTTHVVGDSTGWTIPSGGAQFYATWASKQTFKAGDTLTFNFNPSRHDVAQVTKTNFDSCGTSNTIGSVLRTSPANKVLNSTGEHYFICTFPGHCDAGQKVAINVVSSSTGSPSTQTTESPASSPAPTAGATPSSASLAVGFSIAGIFVAILTAFFL